MILDVIAGVLFGLVNPIVSLLPSTPAAPDLAGMVASAFAPASGVRGVLAQWVPLDEIGTALLAVVTFAVAVTAFRLLAWILCLIHVAGDDA